MAVSKFNLVSPLLTGFSQAYMNRPGSLIAQRVAPIVLVDKDSAKFPVWGNVTKASKSRGKRASGAPSERSTFTLSGTQYKTQERSFETVIDDQDNKGVDASLDLERSLTEFTAQQVLIEYEREAADKLTSATLYSGFTSTLSGASQWSYTGLDPFPNVKTALDSIALNGGISPDQVSLVISYAVYSALRNNSVIRARMAYTNPRNITAQDIADMFGIKEVIVGAGVYEVNGTKTFIWGKHALFAYLQQSPSFYDPSSAKTFVQRDSNMRTEKYRNDEISSDCIRSKMDFDVQITFAGAGYLFVDASA